MNKQDFEMCIMQCLCPGSQYEIEPQVSGHEFPDGWCSKNGVRQFAIEVTRYLPQRSGSNEPSGEQQQQIVGLWRNTIWPKLDELRQKYMQLEHVNVNCNFRVEKKHIKQISSKINEFSEELIRFLIMFVDKKFLQTLPGTGIQFVEIQRLEKISRRVKECHKVFCKEEWPLISSVLTNFRVWDDSCCWLDWRGPDQKAAFIGPQTEEFQIILDDKMPKAKNHKTSNDLPIYLAIACDFPSDNRSAIFPRGRNNFMQGRIEKSFQGCDIDPTTIPFDQIWLVSLLGGKTLRLYPTSCA